jgi:hypothetical protein
MVLLFTQASLDLNPFILLILPYLG